VGWNGGEGVYGGFVKIYLIMWGIIVLEAIKWESPKHNILFALKKIRKQNKKVHI